MRLRTKLTLTFIIFSLAVIVLMMVISELSIDDLTLRNISTSIRGVEGITAENYRLSEEVLTDYGKRIVELKAESAANELSVLLADTRDYDYDRLRANEVLRKIATQKIYARFPKEREAGYIDVGDDTGVAVWHPNQSVEGRNFAEWSDAFPRMWEMVERSFTEPEVSGTYNFFDTDSRRHRDKYMAIRRVRGTPFIVYATVYIDEYFLPVHEVIRKRGEDIISETKPMIRGAVEEFSEEIKIKSFFLGLALLVLAAVFGWWFSSRISRPLLRLRDGVRKLGSGDFNVEVPEGGSAEVVDLTKTFNRLGDQLKSYMANLKTEVAARQAVESEVRIAREIQESLLPRSFPPFPDRPEFDLFALNLAAKEVAGDFYDFFLVDDDQIALVIADVSGKGVPAALFMAVSRTVLKNICVRQKDPAQALREANNALCEGNESSMFVTLILGIYNLNTGKLVMANAGHDELLLLKPDGTVRAFGRLNNIALGIVCGADYGKEDITVEEGDAVIFYTDGVTEATSPENRLFGRERLEKVLADNPGQSARRICREIEKEVVDFQGKNQYDDITVMVIKRNRAGGESYPSDVSNRNAEK